MAIVWTACFRGRYTLCIKLFFPAECLQDGATAWTMHMLQWGWGSEDGAANQVSRDPAQIHINSSTAAVYQHLPLA